MQRTEGSPDRDGDVTSLLRAAHAGDVRSFDQLVPLLYAELRRLAQTLLGEERTGHTLDATALVHEAWIRLAQQHSLGVTQRAQFFQVAATTMRRVLVDHARKRSAEKRGGERVREPLDHALADIERSCGDLLALEAGLQELAGLDERKARLVDLRFFAGLGMRETAELLGISLRQAEREWTTARAFLRVHMEAR